MDCGRHEALKEIVRRSSCVAPAFNKGAYVYIHSPQDAKDAYARFAKDFEVTKEDYVANYDWDDQS